MGRRKVKHRKRHDDEASGENPLNVVRFTYRDVRQHMRDHHARCPKHVSRKVAEHIVGRSWMAKTTIGNAVGLSLEAYVRHQRTAYDTLLDLYKLDRNEARKVVRADIDDVLAGWRTPPVAAREVSETP